MSDVAKRAGVSLAQLRAEFSSTLSILAAHIKDTDQKVLAGGDADMAEETPREKLFDVLMRRLEILSPHRQAIRSLHALGARAIRVLPSRSTVSPCNRSSWMLNAADIKVAGPKGMVRAQGLAMLYRLCHADLGEGRGSGTGPHHGGARPRIVARTALVGIPRRCLRDPERLPRPAAAAPPPA